MDVVIATVESGELDAQTRVGLRTLWNQAFGDRFSDDDAARACGGVHVLARIGDRLVGHASAVPRRLRFGDQPWREAGYVEAVAVEPTAQGTGIGRRLMNRLHDELAARWPVAMLSTGRATRFYESLGWERWQGRSYTHNAAGVVADGYEGSLMILRRDRSDVPDLSVSVTCESQPGRRPW